MLLPVASTLSFFFLPESPVWLVRKGYPEVAKKALIWLRGGNIGQVSKSVTPVDSMLAYIIYLLFNYICLFVYKAN